MRVRDALAQPIFKRAVLRAGETGLDRKVTWAHVVEQPDPLPWLRRGHLLLTTGRCLAGTNASRRGTVERLYDAGIAGVVLAVNQDVTGFPLAALKAADAVGLPLIGIPWDLPFADVTEVLHRIVLGEHYRSVEASELMHRKLTLAALSFRGLQDLAEALGALLNRGVAVEATDGTLLAYHRFKESEDAMWAHTMGSGQRDPQYARYLRELGLDEAARLATVPLRIPGSPDGRIAARVVCPVRLVNELVAYLWIIEGEPLLNELDLRAAEHGAIVAALHLSHRRELWRAEQRLGAALLDTLLELAQAPEPGLLERARLAGISDERTWRLVDVVLPFPLPLEELNLRKRDQVAQRWRGGLRDAGEPALITSHLQHIIALAPAGADFASLAKEQGLELCRILVSGIGSGLRQVRLRWSELQAMLPHVNDPGVHHYSGFLLPRVLAGDHHAKREVHLQMLGDLEALRDGGKLKDTLRSLCKHGFALNLTAADLGVHISTLRYRLERAQDHLGYDLADPDTRFMLRLAFEIERYDPRRSPSPIE